MEQWSNFKEKMQHELELDSLPKFPHQIELEWEQNLKLNDKGSLSLLVEGYKLDTDRGIKREIGCNQFKSVDYIANDNFLSLVEFTDLCRQQSKTLIQIKSIKESDLDEEEVIKPIVKILKSAMQQELVRKFNESLLIIEQMQKEQHCLELSQRYQQNESRKNYLIIIAPLHPNIKNYNKNQLVRLFNHLEKNVTSSLSKAINAKAKIIFIHDFVSKT